VEIQDESDGFRKKNVPQVQGHQAQARGAGNLL
jgi:hypothetical protein